MMPAVEPHAAEVAGTLAEHSIAHASRDADAEDAMQAVLDAGGQLEEVWTRSGRLKLLHGVRTHQPIQHRCCIQLAELALLCTSCG
jgi:hypothetical protein